MSTNYIRDGLGYSDPPPPPPAANTNSQTSPGSTQIQQGMAYTNDPPPEANNNSQRSQTRSVDGLSYSNT
ncbi:hypothetical protein TSUD_413170 [Trifolium subterraneum]|uniref:Uncharacterized protein n=1 Tax=Trifolium subterraneum TaxID=3900 RepID=A0A2Z6P4Q5_TRISU|nr:hypothetical protein TSUD_413170 [Trifolium subterraneum]